MNPDDRASLLEWCKRWRGSFVELRHRPAGTRGVVLSEVQLGDETGEQLIETASRDARNRPPGRLRYEFRAIDVATGRVKDTWSASWHQVGDGSSDDSDDGTSSDGSIIAHVRQLHRHFEVMFKGTLGHTNQILELQSQLITDLTDRAHRLQQEKQALALADDTRREKQHERDIAIVAEAGKSEERAAIWESIRMWVPIALARLNNGTAVIPTSATANELVMYELLRSLSAEQLGTVLAGMKPAQQTALMSLLRSALPVVDRGKSDGNQLDADALTTTNTAS